MGCKQSLLKERQNIVNNFQNFLKKQFNLKDLKEISTHKINYGTDGVLYVRFHSSKYVSSADIR